MNFLKHSMSGLKTYNNSNIYLCLPKIINYVQIIFKVDKLST